MNTLELWMASYLANAVWMVPLVFVATWVATAVTRILGPRIAHRIWVTALWMEVLLPALHLRTLNAGSWWRSLWRLRAIASPEGKAAITMNSGMGPLKGDLVLSYGVLHAVALVYAFVLLYFVARLTWSLWRTRMIASKAIEVSEEAQGRWRAVTAAFGLEADIAASREASGPVTVGTRRGILLLPVGFEGDVTEEDLMAVMAHECAHMVRRDFAKNVLYSLISLPCAFHPLLWLTRSGIAESREMICDAMAAEMLEGSKSYARSLLRLASAMVERTSANIHAIGIFDANHLERRIMSLNRKTTTAGSIVRVSLLATCAAIGLATWASAMTLRTEVGTNAASATEREKPEGQTNLTMPVLIHSERPEYPITGKKDHVNGICLISLTVDEQGTPTHVHIVKSLRPDFDENAIKAVREYRFKPALREGKPVAREIKVEVQFAYF